MHQDFRKRENCVNKTTSIPIIHAERNADVVGLLNYQKATAKRQWNRASLYLRAKSFVLFGINFKFPQKLLSNTDFDVSVSNLSSMLLNDKCNQSFSLHKSTKDFDRVL